MKGKTCVITGATSGIGRAAALQLGRLQADLVLIGRNERQGARLTGRLERECGCPSARFMRADLSLQAEVRRLAADIADRYSCVDVLINNAGARFDRFGRTPDNIETTFATNHLSHFLLTVLLLEKLMKAKTARVITVSSGAHGAGSCDFDHVICEENYDRKAAYATSTLANLMFAFELATRLRNTKITSNAVDPGVVATNFARNNGIVSWMRHLGYHALIRELVLPETGRRQSSIWPPRPRWKGFPENTSSATGKCRIVDLAGRERGREVVDVKCRSDGLGRTDRPDLGDCQTLNVHSHSHHPSPKG